jgi:hypothetical protein
MVAVKAIYYPALLPLLPTPFRTIPTQAMWGELRAVLQIIP